MGSKRKRQNDAPVAATPAPSKKQKKQAPPLEESISPPAPFLDEPRGADLKREVQLYESLASEDSNIRLAAASAIISGLLGSQPVSSATLQRHLERRLCRGLASGRKGARLGYSIVLTEILGQLFGDGADAETRDRYADVSFEAVVFVLVNKTRPEGDLSGQEDRDHQFGRLFGMQCFVRAKVLFGQRSDEGWWESVLSLLLELAGKKPWIREECGWVVVEALEQMDVKDAEKTIVRLCDAGLALSPEGLGIWIMARKRFPDMKVPSKPWGSSGSPLQHLKTLGKALKESSSKDEKDNQAKQTGNWNPQLHWVWGVVAEQYTEGARNGREDNAGEFRDFWKVAVDGKWAVVLLHGGRAYVLTHVREFVLGFCVARAQILGFPFISEDASRHGTTSRPTRKHLQSESPAMPYQPLV